MISKHRDSWQMMTNGFRENRKALAARFYWQYGKSLTESDFCWTGERVTCRQGGWQMLNHLQPEYHLQCFRKRNLAMRTWRSKALQWGKRDLLSKMRPKCGPILELLRTLESLFSSKRQKVFKEHILVEKCKMFFFMVGLLHNTIYHEMHALILVFNLIDTSLSLFYRFTTISLKMGKWDLLSEMRPKCGPFQQFGPHADQVRNCGLLRKHCIWAMPE